ncbi:MAG TPA: glycosyltransferase [Candidatus Omnitrophota bacterium]|nr:glycosyltransferase [Candidatus Omnitrophota bacterium]
MEFIDYIIYASIYLGLIATVFYALSYSVFKKRKELLFSDEELPFVSVLIPAWNEEDTIQKTIESIMASNYKDFEVLVIDDGSKDKTFQLAKALEKKYPRLKVYHKENGGKASALNFGIEKSKGDFIFTMDADTYVHPESVNRMVRYFKDSKVMCVSPAMLVYKPKTILQRIQQAEYLLGLFLRKAFSALDAIFVTPGAFSAYRKEFFKKHGGYEVGNITEDLELALRIQYEGYRIENCPNAPAWTIAPAKFKESLLQRRRWYHGWLKNLWKYRKIFGKKYGDLGSFVIPTAGLNIVFSVVVLVYALFKTISSINTELAFLSTVNFSLSGAWNINLYILERFAFLFFSNPVMIFIIIFIVIFTVYTRYATRKTGKVPGLLFNMFLFFVFFSIIFGFWWIVSIIYTAFHKNVKWR